MKTIKAWAVLCPRKLHSFTMHMPAILTDIFWGYPVFPTRREALAFADRYFARVQSTARLVRVEIREVVPKKGKAKT